MSQRLVRYREVSIMQVLEELEQGHLASPEGGKPELPFSAMERDIVPLRTGFQLSCGRFPKL